MSASYRPPIGRWPSWSARGEFREDLLYRINLIAIHLPPLRERPEDIPVLASRFLHTAAQVYRRDPLTLTPAARRWLQAQPWPGNVRQLRQAVERAVLVGGGRSAGRHRLRRGARRAGAATRTWTRCQRWDR